MIVGYRLQPLSYAVAKILVRVPDVALVNLIAGRRVVPELLQRAWRPDALAAASAAVLSGDARNQLTGLSEARVKLGDPGASRKAAEAVSEYLDG
jgi:lipid-A-disaccharide synthase